jgi:protein-tyrosine kinase
MSRIERALERAANIRTTPAKDMAMEKVTPYVPESNEDLSFVPANPCVVSSQDIHSPAAEEYRKLKTAVLRLTKGEFRNLIMVTSPLSGEGKSITSINLAITMAQELNQTVLLVDADLRRPALQHYLNLTPAAGIADCLADHVDVGDAIVKTGVPKLSFLGAGKKVDNPAELLSSYRMKDLLAELKNRYRDRYIIIDTPPVLPFAETHALCGMVDGVLVVAREGASSLQDIRDALESLQGAFLLGMVYNGSTAPNPASRYGYYGYAYSRRQETK